MRVVVGRDVQVLSASRPELIPVFTGLSAGQFRKLVTVVARRGGPAVADGRPGRQWCLRLPDRVLLVATYYRTNLTDARLNGANLTTAKNLLQQQLDSACGDKDTKLPEGLQRPAHWSADPTAPAAADP